MPYLVTLVFKKNKPQAVKSCHNPKKRDKKGIKAGLNDRK